MSRPRTRTLLGFLRSTDGGSSGRRFDPTEHRGNLTVAAVLSLLIELQALEDDAVSCGVADSAAQFAADARYGLIATLTRARADRDGLGLLPLEVAVGALEGSDELMEALEVLRTRGGMIEYAAPVLEISDGADGLLTYEAA